MTENGDNSTGRFRLNTLGALCADFGGYGIAYEIEATNYNVVGEEMQGYGVAAELMWNCFCWLVIKWIENGFDFLQDNYENDYGFVPFLFYNLFLHIIYWRQLELIASTFGNNLSKLPSDLETTSTS
ncbi:hypothetical protein MKW98_032330 [Papaver atlanticum]|uniref:Uncharacterized protein n=1 Tax=Papaver atlanticum TaxID=357466 RepID=A0AAD4XDL5_9MAGN|nr:hypothetical protein MKW98_032330 [Papaver atlanticum]